MRKYFALVICVIILAGCSNVDELQLMEDENNRAIESMVEEYVVKLKEQDEEIKKMVEELKEVTKVYEQTLEEKKILEDEKKLNDEKKSEVVEDFEFIELSGKIFRLHTAGTNYLEDGIIVILEYYDEDYDLVWLRTWDGIDVTELDTNSPPMIAEENLYIVIDGELNIIDVNNGEILLTVKDVGHSSIPPIIDKDGTIFTIGQYEPYITAIDTNGKVIWQERDEELLNAYDIKLLDDMLEVTAFEGTFLYFKNGVRAE